MDTTATLDAVLDARGHGVNLSSTLHPQTLTNGLETQ